jgi:hypothetical protein
VGNIRDRLRQDSEDRLNGLVMAIGFLSLFQLIFQATEVARKVGQDSSLSLAGLAFSIDLPLLFLALLAALLIISGTIFALISKDGLKKLGGSMRNSSIKRIVGMLLLLAVGATLIIGIWIYT